MAGGAVGERVWTGEKVTGWCVPSAGSHYRANVVLWSPTHTDFESPVKAGYGFVEAPFTAASVSQFPSSERHETEGLFYRKDSL